MLRLQTYLLLTSNLIMNKLLNSSMSSSCWKKMEVQQVKYQTCHIGFEITNEKVIYIYSILKKKTHWGHCYYCCYPVS